jgi:type II secretory pathway component HofQ
VEKLKEDIQGSSFQKVGLSGTVVPSVDNDEKIELLEILSEDEVKRFVEMAEENFQNIELQNREFACKYNNFI